MQRTKIVLAKLTKEKKARNALCWLPSLQQHSPSSRDEYKSLIPRYTVIRCLDASTMHPYIHIQLKRDSNSAASIAVFTITQHRFISKYLALRFWVLQFAGYPASCLSICTSTHPYIHKSGLFSPQQQCIIPGLL